MTQQDCHLIDDGKHHSSHINPIKSKKVMQANIELEATSQHL